MIQGDLTTIPLTSAAGYQANSFIIVHFTDGNPDMGRKVFQPELKELADVLSRRVVSEIRKYQALLKPDTGAANANLSKELEEWKDTQKEWAKSNPLRLTLDQREITFLSLPREEQDVIALYHQLVGMGVIKGMQFFGTGYNTRYDGLAKYRYRADDRYNDDQFWGVDARYAPSESGAQVLEYKYSMDSLVTDFQKDEKSPQEINLLICWQVGTEYKRNFEIVPLTINQDGATREFFGSTHAVYIGTGRATKVFEIVCLSDFLVLLPRSYSSLCPTDIALHLRLLSAECRCMVNDLEYPLFSSPHPNPLPVNGERGFGRAARYCGQRRSFASPRSRAG